MKKKNRKKFDFDGIIILILFGGRQVLFYYEPTSKCPLCRYATISLNITTLCSIDRFLCLKCLNWRSMFFLFQNPKPKVQILHLNTFLGLTWTYSPLLWNGQAYTRSKSFNIFLIYNCHWLSYFFQSCHFLILNCRHCFFCLPKTQTIVPPWTSFNPFKL